MYRFSYSFGLLLFTSFILSYARSIFISHTGAETHLPSSSESDLCMTPTCVIAAADVLTSLDETVDPCDDFYSFACGGWIKRTEVSDDQPDMNPLFTIRKDLDRKLRDLLESKSESSDPSFVRTLKNFYNTCADLDKLEKDGSEPLRKMLTLLGGWPVIEGSRWDESAFDWVDTLITFRKLGYSYGILLELFVHTDPKNDAVNIIYLEEPNIRRLSSANLSFGLDDPKIAAYYRTIVKAAKLLGAEEATAEKEILEALHFEMDLINIIKSTKKSPASSFFGGKQVKRKNTFAKLQNELPQVPWLKIVNGLLLDDKVNENETFLDSNHKFLVKFADFITSTDKRVIANYILWQAVLQSGKYLSEEWKDVRENEEEDESSKESKIVEKPRWKQCLEELVEKMDIGISSYYVRHYLGDESKNEAIIMMKYIHKEFLKILENNDWMDEKTREKAEEKANAIKAYIGYPKELLNDTFMMKEYENLTLTTDSYLENILAYQKWETDKHFLKLSKDMSDMKEMNSLEYSHLTDVNAFYFAFQNSLSIPAGILHVAFYDKDKPKYMNFGMIGFIIGHEITHGFDNEGRYFDKDGKRKNWWDKETDKHFRNKVKCLISQYDNYTTDIGMKVNGKKTQNENIADNGGLKEAYLAYHSWTKDHGIEPLLPGVNYNQNQLFWVSAAHTWCSKYQPDRLKELLLTDQHSPGKFRIIGPMSNLAEFSNDFKCSPEAPMNRKHKCQVW